MNAQAFDALTPSRILDAVEAFGVRATGRVSALNSMENRVYEVELDEETPRAGKKKFVVAKFYRPGRWSKEQLAEEHQFIFDLEEYDIPVTAPLRAGGGESLLTEPNSQILYSLFPKAGGRNPDELNDSEFEQLGRLLGRMHNVGAIRQAPHRIRISPETYGIQSLEFLLSANSLPENLRHAYEQIVRQICDLSTPRFEGIETQRIHGDCHLGNILHGAGGFVLVDFDDMLQGPCVQDLWLLISGRSAADMANLEALLSGYEQMRAFDRRTLALVEPLRALRMIYFSAWIARRWDDEAFKRAFPYFGTERYWREQIETLSEQLEIIAESY